MISIKIYLNNYALILFERNYISKLRSESSSEQCERFEILFRTILYDNLTKNYYRKIIKKPEIVPLAALGSWSKTNGF